MKANYGTWGNGDSLCAHPDGRSLIAGGCRANGKFAFGQDRDGDGRWEVAEVPGGFMFRNKASGLYLGGSSSRKGASSSPAKTTTATTPMSTSRSRTARASARLRR